MVREGKIPLTLGIIVTGAGIAMLVMEVAPMVGAGVVGFGVAHIVLGSIDLIQHKKHINFR
ncbi:asparagine synthase [Clostridium algoriphilum]|uniref:asparagine synthase n=1 Tax=Clostridium algoriphilum TaxID=198347 RepID=UPI001CF41E93|nr:asparagine synthase [Clostridium algoriphilum]MCB2292378.1 asparagine synthase [Clostridium algoriphilum]